MGSIATRLGRIGVVESGSGADGQAPALFLHGVGSDKSVWQPQLDHFGRTRRAIALDYPGYGDSGPPPADCDRDDFARATLAALDSLGVEQAHLCGLSLGGVIAIAMHALAPGRCLSLVLADSFAVHPEGQAIYDRSVAASRDPGMRALAEQRAPMLLAPDVPDRVRRSVIDTMAAIDPEAYRIGARAVWLADQCERAAAIRVPTLVLVGSIDPVTPPALSQALAALVPASRLQILDGASHIANLDRPDDFNRAVDRFLAEVEGSAQDSLPTA